MRTSERRDPPAATLDASNAFRPAIAIALLGVAAAGLLALGARLCWINAVERDELLAWSQQQRVGQIPWPARRGFVLDRRGRILAGTRERHSLFCDPQLVDDFVPIALKLSAILGAPPGTIHQKLDERSESRFVWLARHLDDAQADAIRALDCGGLGLISESERQYPNGQLAGHALGFVGRDGHGLEGIEAYYEKSLAGVDGRSVVLKDASRKTLAVLADGSAPPQNGRHVVLTIDSVIQSYLEQALAEGVAQREAESGVGIVMDPRTGEILAMACVPGFDPANFSVVQPELRRNRIVTDPVEPGSIFKPYVGCMVLAEKVVRIEEPIFCHNGLFVSGARRIHDVHPAGTIPFRDVIVKSSNIGMAIVGDRLGKERMERYLRAFGYGALTGLEFPGESEGLLLPISQWSGYSAMSISFGQELAATPLQLATAFCAILNDGVLLKPRLVRAILAGDGTEVERFDEPEVVREVVPGDVARLMTREILAAVVAEGSSASQAKLENYIVVGKTGTAQIPHPDRRGYEPEAYLSSFMGAAPRDDPRLAVLVMIRKPNPRKGYYGGLVSAPVVREVLKNSLPYLHVPPDTPAEPNTVAVRN